jgi:hypothetical protein
MFLPAAEKPALIAKFACIHQNTRAFTKIPAQIIVTSLASENIFILRYILFQERQSQHY